MANPSPLTILLRFLQPGLRRHRGQARTLTLHQNIIDDNSAINQNVKSITSVQVLTLIESLLRLAQTERLIN